MSLKEKITKQTQSPYYTTLEDIEVWFDLINDSIFDAQLTPFENIAIKRLKLFWGYVCYDVEIKNPPYDVHLHMKFPNKQHFINILAHEMVHKWQMEINQDSGCHNKHFFSWRPKFTENGLTLSRTY